MGDKRVTISRHIYFYPIFFEYHKNTMSNFLDLSFTTLTKGFDDLGIYYGSYSYYLKDYPEDVYFKDLLSEKLNELLDNKKYVYLKDKLNSQGVKSFKYEELKELNLIFHNSLVNMLEIFEGFCHKLAPTDLLPKMTNADMEIDLELNYVVYDEFYKSFYGLQKIIINKLNNFTILEFKEMFQVIIIFFYGYSYYLEKNTIKEVKNKFELLFKYYNNESFLRLYFKLINDKIDRKGLLNLNDYKKKMFNDCLSIFELINNDLPKSNLMPKKQDKVMIDDTLI